MIKERLLKKGAGRKSIVQEQFDEIIQLKKKIESLQRLIKALKANSYQGGEDGTDTKETWT